MKFILYTDKDGKKRLRRSEEQIKEENKRKEKKKLEEKERKNKQEDYIKYLMKILPKDRCDENLIRRFFSQIDVRGENDCWKWLGYVASNGYGRVWFNLKREYVHRIVYTLIHGEISDDMPFISHLCNKPLCVNPNHLKADTQQGNMKYRDMCNRQPKGEKNGNAKLKQEIVDKMRKDYNDGLTLYEISEKYDISVGESCRVINNHQWKDMSYIKKAGRNGYKGEKNGRAKNTWKKVNEIREDWKIGKYSQYELSAKYSVPRGTIKFIVNNETWIDDNYQKWIDNKSKKVG